MENFEDGQHLVMMSKQFDKSNLFTLNKLMDCQTLLCRGTNESKFYHDSLLSLSESFEICDEMDIYQHILILINNIFLVIPSVNFYHDEGYQARLTRYLNILLTFIDCVSDFRKI